MSSEWVLYYWAGFPGRGEFVRLIFEEAGEKYTEENSGEVIMSEIIQGKGDGYPMFAPPLIKKGIYFVSFTKNFTHDFKLRVGGTHTQRPSRIYANTQMHVEILSR